MVASVVLWITLRSKYSYQLLYCLIQILIGFRFSIWFLCKLVLKLCDGKSMLPVVKVFVHNMHMSPQKLIIFPSFLAKNNFVCFSHDSTFNIAYHTMVSPNIMFNFYWYCMLQSFSCAWCSFYHQYNIYITLTPVVILKSAIFCEKRNLVLPLNT